MKPCLSCEGIIKKNPRYSKTQWEAQKYCKRTCRISTNIDKACDRCNKIFTVKNYRKDTAQYCSVECRKVEIQPDGQGYIRLGSTRQRQHRALAGLHLGRELTTDEVVHHLNGKKADNRIENLIIVTRAWHAKIHHSMRRREAKKEVIYG